MNIADNTHNTSADALWRILSWYADGGRTLELLILKWWLVLARAAAMN